MINGNSKPGFIFLDDVLDSVKRFDFGTLNIRFD